MTFFLLFKIAAVLAAAMLTLVMLALSPSASQSTPDADVVGRKKVSGIAGALLAMLVLMIISPSASAADPLTVGREFVCNPVDGRQTCLQGVVLADDVTMALIAGAPDYQAMDTARWVTQSDFSEELGYQRYTQRVTQLAFRDGLNISPLSAVVNRRQEVQRAKRFLIPVGPIETIKEAGGFFRLRARDMDSRTRYTPEGADICTTTKRSRFCVRLPDVTGVTLSQRWNQTLPVMGAIFEGYTPHFMSEDWKRHTMLAVEVELIDRTPVAIDGARTVTAKPVSLVVYNLSRLVSSKNALIVQTGQPLTIAGAKP